MLMVSLATMEVTPDAGDSHTAKKREGGKDRERGREKERGRGREGEGRREGGRNRERQCVHVELS